MGSAGATLEENTWTVQGLHWKIIHGQCRGYIGKESMDSAGLHWKRTHGECRGYIAREPMNSAEATLKMNSMDSAGATLEENICTVHLLILKGNCMQCS